MDAAIQGLIGLDRNQFAQTVMIAQGDFLKILNATSDERRKLFRKLFATSRYERFEEMLKAENDAARDAQNRIDEAIRNAASGIQATDDAAAPFQELLHEPSYIDKALPMLKKIVDEAAGQLAAYNAQREKTEQALAEKTAEADYIKTQNKLLTSLQDTEKELAVLGQREKEIAALQQKIEAAAHAARLNTFYNTAVQAEKQAEKVNRMHEDLQKALPAAEAAAKESAAAFQAAQSRAEALPELDAELLKHQHAIELLRKGKAARDRHRAESEKRIALARKAEHARKAFDVCWNAYIAGTAGLLAEQLTDNIPCPVCGALHHPAPAQKPENTPTKDAVDAANQAMTAAIGALEKQNQVVKDQSTKLTEIEDELKALFGETVPAESALQTASAEIAQTAAQIKAALTAAQNQAHKDEKELAAKQAACDATAKQLAESTQFAAQAAKQYAEELAASDFADEQAFLAALLAPALQQQYQKTVSDYREQQNLLRGKREELRTRCKITEPLPLEETEQALVQLRLQKMQTDAMIRTTEQMQALNGNALKQLEALAPQRMENDRLFRNVNDLYETVRGKQSGQAKLNFEAYVQQFYFRRVIEAANRRLLELSNETYSLRCKKDATNLRSHQELDLEVFDANTGAWREVATLSGGESFLASLSLALGLSDVVQAQSGGVQLDAMFIDEGFGSLDDQTLRQAVRMLAKLADGSRLVGVISHVSELKNAIPAQIRVTKDENGSRIRII